MRKYTPPNLPRSMVEALIDEWVRWKRKRALLKAVYFDETPIEHLAEEFDTSVSTVKRDLDTAQKQLYAHLISEPGPETQTEA